MGRLRGRGNSREKETRNVDNFVEILAFQATAGAKREREREREREPSRQSFIIYEESLHCVKACAIADFTSFFFFHAFKHSLRKIKHLC